MPEWDPRFLALIRTVWQCATSACNVRSYSPNSFNLMLPVPEWIQMRWRKMWVRVVAQSHLHGCLRWPNMAWSLAHVWSTQKTSRFCCRVTVIPMCPCCKKTRSLPLKPQEAGQVPGHKQCNQQLQSIFCEGRMMISKTPKKLVVFESHKSNWMVLPKNRGNDKNGEGNPPSVGKSLWRLRITNQLTKAQSKARSAQDASSSSVTFFHVSTDECMIHTDSSCSFSKTQMI